ncbi:HD domain-containing protein [bacterium]|nr:HD domain-containing protein [bacterium]
MSKDDRDDKLIHQQLKKFAEDVSRLYKDLKEENIRLKKANRELEENYYKTVLIVFDLINLNDEFLGNHCKRVAFHADKLAKCLNMKGEVISDVKLAALLHDIGLMGIPKKDLVEMITNTNQIFQNIYRKHPAVNLRLFSSSGRFEGIGKIIAAHHENLDGSGFPLGLKGDNIPIESKIIAIVNGYDEIKMVHKKKLKPEDVISKMEGDVCIKYDFDIYVKFKEMILGSDPFSETCNVGVYELEPGMILAKSIFSINEKIKILSSDTVIREDHIEHLKGYFEYANLKLPITIYKF